MTQKEDSGPPSDQPDYSPLDVPEMLTRVFHPRRYWTPTPAGAQDFMIPVEEDVSISGRFYLAPEGGANILYFHGNGEVACDYDGELAFVYNQLGIGLFVADYRGYGQSDGTPTFSTMANDADLIFRYFEQVAKSTNPDARLFVMGRSLGCVSALEVAFKNQGRLDGLIIDSGVANIAENTSIFGFSSNSFGELAQAISVRVNSIEIPSLVIHGELDTLVPSSVGVKLHRDLGSKQKDLVMIPRAQHNNIMFVGDQQYFSSILGFVSRD